MKNIDLNINQVKELIQLDQSEGNQLVNVKIVKNKYIALIEEQSGDYIQDVYIQEDGEMLWVERL